MARDHRAHRFRHEAAGHSLPRRAVRRADDHGERAQAHRIQYALRRSRMRGADAAASGRPSRRPPATVEGRVGCARSRLARRGRADGGHGRERLPGKAADRNADQGHRSRRHPGCTSWFSTPARRARPTVRWSRMAAGCLRSRRWAPPSARHRGARIRPWTRSIGPADSAGGISDGGPLGLSKPSSCSRTESNLPETVFERTESFTGVRRALILYHSWIHSFARSLPCQTSPTSSPDLRATGSTPMREGFSRDPAEAALPSSCCTVFRRRMSCGT